MSFPRRIQSGSYQVFSFPDWCDDDVKLQDEIQKYFESLPPATVPLPIKATKKPKDQKPKTKAKMNPDGSKKKTAPKKPTGARKASQPKAQNKTAPKSSPGNFGG